MNRQPNSVGNGLRADPLDRNSTDRRPDGRGRRLQREANSCTGSRRRRRRWFPAISASRRNRSSPAGTVPWNAPWPSRSRRSRSQSAAPRAIQIPIRRAPIRVRSFEFPEPSETAAPASLPAPAAPPGKAQAAGGALKLNVTRIRPPEDVIKLEDRLQLSPATAVGGAALRSRVGDAAASRFPFSSKAWRSSIRGMRRSWPMKWGWERPCRRSRRSASCSAAARSAAS